MTYGIFGVRVSDDLLEWNKRIGQHVYLMLVELDVLDIRVVAVFFDNLVQIVIEVVLIGTVNLLIDYIVIVGYSISVSKDVLTLLDRKSVV